MELSLLLTAKALVRHIQNILENLKVYCVFKGYVVFFKYVLNSKRIPRVWWYPVIRVDCLST